ncbi:MAG: rhomboid family intramembrane serine protease [Longimicrobiales bacterium]
MFLPFGLSMTPWVKRLVIANGGVFLLSWLLPAVAAYLALYPMRLLTLPWTPLTYMFVHAGFLHLLFNMIGLFFFGPPLEARWGSKEFVRFYLVCGLGGAAFSFIFAPQAAVVGASAAVFGVLLAFAMNWPDAPIYIWGILPVKAKWLIAFLAAITLLSAFGGSGDGVAHFAHLGGFVAGWVYLKLDPFGRTSGGWRASATAAPRGRRGPGRTLGDRLRRLRPRTTLRVMQPGDDPADRQPPRRRVDERVLDEIDRVLDKISREGMSSLSPEEKRLLDDVSRRYRHD